MKKFTLAALSLLLLASVGAAGEEKDCFIPKGSKSAGIVFSYNDYNIGNETGYDALFSMIQGAKATLDTWKFSFAASYFLKDNMSVGLRLNYDRTSIGIDQADLSLSDVGLSLGNHYHLSHEYSAALTARSYLPIAGSRRFAFFTELALEGGLGQGKTYAINDGRKEGTYFDKYSLSLAFSPGISAFVMKNIALEFSLDLMSLDWTNTVQVANRVDYSSSNNFGIHYNIDLLSSRIALVMYF